MGLSSPIHLLHVFDTCCTVSWRSVGSDTIAPKVRKSLEMIGGLQSSMV